MGWDVAFTDTGSMIIEANDDWDSVIPMTLEPDFKARFDSLFCHSAGRAS